MNFFDIHKGETCLLVGNAPNLLETPPELFDYPSFGLNTIFYYEGWKPSYFVAVDEGVYELFGETVSRIYNGIPKFVSSPTLDCWQGADVYHFKKLSGDIKIPKREDVFKVGLTYHNVMHVAMQLAWHMGFTTCLMIGVEQKPGLAELKKHFWGTFEAEPDSQIDTHWNIGYKAIVRALDYQMKIYNISQGTYVPEDVLPHDDWRKYAQVTA
jgi:hypothetical protein